jgi:hypothetical protein
MPKKKLTALSEEYGIPFEEALDLVFKELEEDMVTGKGKNTWINEDGQRVLDEFISMPVLYRGPVLYEAPNPSFIMVYVKELSKKVPVRIPLRFKGTFPKGKVVYLEADNSSDTPKYNWVRTPQRTFRG